jgi:3-isopropylmalate/(R)-2-methylmalate dehydratase small subunit
MQAFTVSTGVAAPVIRDNIDTDMLIRIERLAQLKRGQFGPWLFEMWRYLDDGTPNPDFILNQAPFDGASFIVAGRNFGCGSSREMAVWALQEFGIRCVMAESFGDIFYTNCFQNGVLPIVLEREQLQAIAQAAQGGQALTVDLENSVITLASLPAIPFSVPQAHRSALLLGQDEIAQTQTYETEIAAFQARDRASRPWVYQPA